MSINVRNLSVQPPKTFPVDIMASEPTEHLKSKIQTAIGSSPQSQRVVFNGKQLQDGESLSTYGINDGSQVDLTIS